MRNIVIFLLFIAASLIFALDNATVPYTFSASTVARSSEVNDNYDSLKTAFNRNNDTLDAKFVRFADFADSTIGYLSTDTINTTIGATPSNGLDTIDSDTVNFIGSFIKITSEGSAETDTVRYIKGGYDGAIVTFVLDSTSTAIYLNDIVFATGGNLAINGSSVSGSNKIKLTSLSSAASFIYNPEGSVWVETGRDVAFASVIGGKIDGTPIGGTSVSTGAFSSLSATTVIADSFTTDGSKFFNYFDTTFTCTLNGVDTLKTVTAGLVKIGKVVTVTIPKMIAVSNSNICNITMLPGYVPVSYANGNYLFPLKGFDNGSGVDGYIEITDSTLWSLSPGVNGATTGWTTSGNKGFVGFTVSYVLE